MITYLPRVTVPFEKLMGALLDYPGLTVKPRVDTQSLDRLPLLTYSGSNGAMVSNGAPQLGWAWTLFLSLLTQDLANGDDLADTVYQLVHGMESAWDPSKVVPGVGQVVSVEDVSMFDRIATTDLPDRRIVQYSATFTLIVQPA